MPDFDGTGPLKRGKLIGRGRGNCQRNDQGSGQGNRIRLSRSKNPGTNNVTTET